jgi:drug/metabolite transporter (DMT)-like permease
MPFVLAYDHSFTEQDTSTFMGSIAALVTAACWAATSLFFTAAGKEVGSVVVNRVRLLLAVIFLVLIHWLLTGTLIPLNAGAERWFWLGLSGIIGLVLGDLALFQSYVMIGPRLGTLIMAGNPVIGTLLAWVFLGERLGWLEIAGIFLTVAGITWVVMERSGGLKADAEVHTDRRHFILGVLCAFGGALGQAVGLILAKKGMTGDFPSISGVVIRMVSAAVAIWLMTIISGQARATVQAIRAKLPVLRTLVLGTLVGPVAGVWLSLIAVQLAPVGIASTLMALTPIMLLPFSRWVFQEKVSLRAVAGTLVSIAGVVIIFMG